MLKVSTELFYVLYISLHWLRKSYCIHICIFFLFHFILVYDIHRVMKVLENHEILKAKQYLVKVLDWCKRIII